MFPDHCKEVSVRRVDFDLTPDNLEAYFEGKKAYIRTKFFVVNNGNQWAVVRVGKEAVNGVLQPVTDVEIVAMPEETSFVDDPSLDVLSASRMGRLRELEGSRCIVVRGTSEHMSFFVDQPAFELTVVDVVPPSPTKLTRLVGDALDSHLQDAFVKYRVVERDIGSLLAPSEGNPVLFPCRASGMTHPGMLGFLDETPELTPEQVRSASLIGCSLSARIFKAVYGEEPRLINMCPVDLLSGMEISGKVLTKCCKVKEGYELRGDVAVVPWGARVSDVAAALDALISA